jgi:anaerobic selenocysteine-containing dehydrogenase
MTDRIADPWGARTPHGRGERWPARADRYLQDGIAEHEVDAWVQSACILCSNGCGMDIAVKDGRMVGVRGRVEDRVNHGRLGPKGLFGWQANHSADRLTRPLVRRGGKLVESDWDTAMGMVVRRSKELLAAMGPGAMAMYTSGQLMLEEYYLQAMIMRAGIGSNHLDGNTRLCTATAAEALKESFACDGQPGSYADIEHCDAILLVGHNIAETQTVLWMRMLDRLRGPDRPRLVVIDPRPTPAAREADVHLAIRNGTNVAILNAIQHELVAHGWVDRGWVDAHTVGYPELRDRVMEYPPERAARICGVTAEEIRDAARIIGSCDRLLSTALQGVYQSHQATAAAVQVNNINLLRGMIGRPGAGVYQMNGQPTAQNARECGADGDLPGFRNFQNDAHVAELARIWNVDPIQIPHYSSPTSAMEIFRYAEEGSIRFLWITATNPLVSLPELHRIRAILEQERLFVVVSDAWLTETAQVADIVLPAAIWGEKTGTFTNVDRTVHLSEKAIEPPGTAKPDLEILMDYARRMNFRDKDGGPLIAFDGPESVFDGWRECSRGRPCDYSGITYEKLRGGSGIQWPCTEHAPEGTERLYADGVFWSDAGYCESWGKDLQTGATWEETEYRALRADGRAILKAAAYLPPHELPSREFPFMLSTGRTLYHWHTRTKTGRAPQLDDAAPEVWAELCAGDAEELGIAEGDPVEVASPRGAVRARARLTGIRPGLVFIPFHYGYWDTPGGFRPDGRSGRAANELTLSDWDPASKQPLYKVGAARVTRVAAGDGRPAPAPTTAASAPVRPLAEPTRGGPSAESAETAEVPR